MTHDQLIKLAAASPVTLKHAADSLGVTQTEVLTDGKRTGELLKRHADLTGEWIAHMLDEIDNLAHDLD